MKLHWEKLHDGWQEDFKDWAYLRKRFIELQRKHPDSPIFIDTIKLIDKLIQTEQRRYKEIYGTRFNSNR